MNIINQETGSPATGTPQSEPQQPVTTPNAPTPEPQAPSTPQEGQPAAPQAPQGN